MKKEETATSHQNSLMDEHLSESIPSHLEYGGAVDISPFPSFGSPGLRKLYDKILSFFSFLPETSHTCLLFVAIEHDICLLVPAKFLSWLPLKMNSYLEA